MLNWFVNEFIFIFWSWWWQGVLETHWPSFEVLVNDGVFWMGKGWKNWYLECFLPICYKVTDQFVTKLEINLLQSYRPICYKVADQFVTKLQTNLLQSYRRICYKVTDQFVTKLQTNLLQSYRRICYKVTPIWEAGRGRSFSINSKVFKDPQSNSKQN
jgi:hypothetical protein